MEYAITFERYGEEECRKVSNWESVKYEVSELVINEDVALRSISIYEIKEIENVHFNIGIEVGPS